MVSTARQQDDFREPSIERTTLSIEMPPLKLTKHMIERMKFLSDFIFLEATDKGMIFFLILFDSVLKLKVNFSYW